MGFIQQKQAEKQKQWRVIQSKVDLRLLAKVVIAWRDCTRLKLISLPSHLYALAGTWGAGAAYWRLVRVEEAERHAAHAAAHHQRASTRSCCARRPRRQNWALRSPPRP